MKEIVKQLVALLKSNPDFIAVMDKNLFPLAAPEGTGSTFALYSVGSEPMSKDGRQYNAGLQLFFPVGKFNEMLDFADVCTGLLNEKYDVGTVETDYSNDYKSLLTTINFIID